MMPPLCRLLLLLLLPTCCLCQSTSIAFSQPGNCSSSQYYNVASYACDACQTPSIQAPDGLRCTCPDTYTVQSLGSPQVTCSSCANETRKVSLDRRLCLACSSSQCSCGSGSVTEEDYINQSYRCVTCTGTTPNAAGNQCVPCQPTYKENCTCPTANQVGGLCVPDTPESVTSVTFWESLYLYPSYDVCKEYNNITACQVVTNMVIMNAFSSTSKAYDYYSLIPTSNSFRPPLIYSTLSQLGLTAPSNLSFQKNAQIQFRLAKYDVRGNFLGWQTLKGGTLQMCPNTQSVWDAAFKFGNYYSLSCSLSVSDLFQAVPEPIFYELFLPYTSTSGASMLWPIPVWNANIQGSSGTLGSRALRRFFLVDGISGRQSNLSSQPSYVTVATGLTLSVYLPVSNPSSQPPFQLTVTYEKKSLQALAQVSFAVTYTQSQGSYKTDTDISLGVLGALAGLLAILETSSWLRRSGQQYIGIMVIIKFLAFLCGTLANTFFLIVYGTAVYWLIAFKGQTSSVSVTLPPSGGQVETNFIIYLSVAFALKALELLHLLVAQLTVNIFLIDWERPKEKGSSNAPGKSNVSIWRTVLVANEWNEIQTHRKLSPLFQLFLVLLLLEVVGLKNITAKDLNLDLNPAVGTYLSPWSIILRFGIAASMWLAVGLVQVLFFIFIYERFVEDKIKQFTDLCSLSNVSVLVLTHKCYGYYIHGRSVHGQADVSMEVMMDNLRKEEENLCPLRGLEPGSDVQTFEVMLSERVREQYDKIMQPLAEAPRGQKSVNERNPQLQQRIKTYFTINRFLSAFLDHVYKDLDYVVKNKLLLENILDLEFQQPTDKSIVYNDVHHRFSRTLFYSNELVLLMFDMLLFCVIDLGTQNFILATILTFVIQMFVKILRSQIGRKNLSAQTLVEESFLI
ncbi:meckelin-like [Hyperolius riggenbachi]|uniref:meckelin-like n=1 Tax=Hyperolius riggenbachi TaxID=752182 RepID=UPI0035A2872D